MYIYVLRNRKRLFLSNTLIEYMYNNCLRILSKSESTEDSIFLIHLILWSAFIIYWANATNSLWQLLRRALSPTILKRIMCVYFLHYLEIFVLNVKNTRSTRLKFCFVLVFVFCFFLTCSTYVNWVLSLVLKYPLFCTRTMPPAVAATKMLNATPRKYLYFSICRIQSFR